MNALSCKLYMVVPCYNEEAVLPETARRLAERFASLAAAGLIAAGVAAGGAAFTSHRRHATEDAPGHAELEPPPDEG